MSWKVLLPRVRKGFSIVRRVDSKENDVSWCVRIVEHELREIEYRVVLPRDETVTSKLFPQEGSKVKVVLK